MVYSGLVDIAECWQLLATATKAVFSCRAVAIIVGVGGCGFVERTNRWSVRRGRGGVMVVMVFGVFGGHGGRRVWSWRGGEEEGRRGDN